ncbi:MAG TPA: transcriptional regulator [Firmicutes bacterium]|nr:transcriptional regulator [Bacillota bacterium]
MKEEIRAIMNILPSLANALGSCYELVLHDFSDIDHSIVAIEGNITGREVGGSVTDLGLRQLQNNMDKDLVGYKIVLPDGKTLKCSSIFIRDKAGQVIGSLCINFLIDDFLLAQRTIQSLIKIESEERDEHSETFPADVGQLVNLVIKNALDSVNKPVTFMNKEDKLSIVKECHDRGLFLVRGGVDEAANALSLSRATVYSYLEEIRNQA